MAPAHVVVLLWQDSQLPVTAACVALLGLPTAIWKAPVWQLAQLPATVMLLWNLPLAHVLKLPRWQVSQLADAATAIDA